MEYFLSEVYNTEKLSDTHAVLADIVDISKGALLYNKIYDDVRVHCILQINWVFRQIFGILPSKVHLILINKKYGSRNVRKFKEVVDILRNEISFVKLMCNDLYYKNMVDGFESEYNIYTCKLQTNNAAFVKNELSEMLHWRFHCSSIESLGNQATSTNKTLYTQFMDFVQNDPERYFQSLKGEFENKRILEICHLTNVPIPNTFAFETETMTLMDALTWSFYSNSYLLRVCCHKNLVVLSSELSKSLKRSIIKKLGGNKSLQIMIVSEDKVCDNIWH
jgi:hypothetical protein